MKERKIEFEKLISYTMEKKQQYKYSAAVFILLLFIFLTDILYHTVVVY